MKQANAVSARAVDERKVVEKTEEGAKQKKQAAGRKVLKRKGRDDLDQRAKSAPSVVHAGLWSLPVCTLLAIENLKLRERVNKNRRARRSARFGLKARPLIGQPLAVRAVRDIGW